MIQQQLLSPPSPQVLPFPHPPQQERSRRIQIQDIPLLFSQPHPQFVAVKSLISFPPKFSFTVYHMWFAEMCYTF